MQKLIINGHILVNGACAKSNHNILPGESIDVVIPPAVKSKIEPEKIKLNIVYEDKDLLVVNKPVGMVVHPAPGSKSKTLVNALNFNQLGYTMIIDEKRSTYEMNGFISSLPPPPAINFPYSLFFVKPRRKKTFIFVFMIFMMHLP